MSMGKFAIGDQVKVIDSLFDVFMFKTGTVIKYDDNGNPIIYMPFLEYEDEAVSCNVLFAEEQLQKIV